MLFTTSCAGCNEVGDTLCRRCRFVLATTAAPELAPGLAAALPFDGVVRQTILSLKYRNQRGAAKALAQVVVRRLALRGDRFDVVTWAPTSAARAQRRGFDQSELLARAVAAELGVPCRRLLFRGRGPAQTGQSRQERLAGPEFRGRRHGGPRVLLVDDVITTGATIRAAKAALARAGVGRVTAVAVAAVAPAVVRHVHARRPLTAGSGDRLHRPPVGAASAPKPVGSLGGPPIRLAG